MFKIVTFGIALLGFLIVPNLASTQAAPSAAQTTSGVFLGIEQGDYAHWKLRKSDGEEVSYFILKPDASVEKVLANPKKRIGQKCEVQWKTTTENIPEAGGKIEVEQILSVEWLK